MESSKKKLLCKINYFKFISNINIIIISFKDESEFDRFMEANDPNSLPKDKLEKFLQRQG